MEQKGLKQWRGRQSIRVNGLLMEVFACQDHGQHHGEIPAWQKVRA